MVLHLVHVVRLFWSHLYERHIRAQSCWARFGEGKEKGNYEVETRGDGSIDLRRKALLG